MSRSAPGNARLCYILPAFDPATHEHLRHTYDFLSQLAETIDLAVIVERAVAVPSFGRAHVSVQRWTRLPGIRLLELTLLCVRHCRAGVDTFYVRYSYWAAWAAWLATRICGGRVAYWHCTSMVFRPRTPRWRTLVHWLRAELPLDVTMKLVDVLVTGTEGLAAFYAREFGIDRARIRVIPNEIDATRFVNAAQEGLSLRSRLGIEPNEPVVLFVHRIVERKGAHLLLPIMSRLLERVPAARLVVVGTGPLLPDLRAGLARDATLAQAVLLAGPVPNEQVAAYYGCADVLLVPSLEEGVPRVVLEAMASGTPYVAADVGGIREISTEVQASLLVRAGDVEGFSRQVAAVLGDAPLRERLRAEGLRHVRGFSRDVVIARTVDALVDAAPARVT